MGWQVGIRAVLHAANAEAVRAFQDALAALRHREHDEPDFSAVDSSGLPVMPDYAHVTRAHVTDWQMEG